MSQSVVGGAEAVYFEHGCERVISAEELAAKLAEKRPLRVKLGFDPSSPDLHLGHAVVLDKVRQFQDAGHQAVIIIGDYTARIGDPTGRSKTRVPLSPEQVEVNAKTYTEQVFKILDERRTEIRRNSEWFDKFTYADVLKLNSRMTVARLLEREDFRKRYSEGAPITLTEFQYPLMQGWDSVMIGADVELGGSDQLFNNLVGRELQRDMGQPPQCVMVLPILEGTDGVEKMSKSLGNAIGITMPPFEMFSKIMSISDELMARWYPLLLKENVEASAHPMDSKKALARRVTARFHSVEAARRAQEDWEQQFSQRQVPEVLEEVAVANFPTWAHLLKEAGLCSSTSEARRLIAQGGVTLDGERVQNANEQPRPGVLKCGKRHYRRLV
jgi:tyrosyl-tRNA synthetase